MGSEFDLGGRIEAGVFSLEHKLRPSHSRGELSLLVQNNRKQRLVDLDLAVVFDEPQFSELVHEEIHSGTRGSHHARQSVLGDFRQYAIRLVLFAIARQQQKRSRKAFFAGVEELIDQVFFDSDITCKHVCDEMVRELMLRVKGAQQLFLLNYKQRGRCYRGSRAHTDRLARHASLAEEVCRAKHGHDRFLASSIHDSQFHAAALNVHHGLGSIALRINRLASTIFLNFSGHAGRIEKILCIERVGVSLLDLFSWFHIEPKCHFCEGVRSRPYSSKPRIPKLYKTGQRALLTVSRIVS